MSYTLATAAEAAGVTKPTLWRWIKSGKVSATKAEDGSYRVDPAELHRYLDSVKETPAPQRSDTVADTMSGRAGAPLQESSEAIALRYEVEKVRALLDIERQRAEDLRQNRDRWASQAERLAITGPATAPTMPAVAPELRHWWHFGRRA